MGLVERTLCIGALRIINNLAGSKGSVFIESVSGQTIVLLLFTDISVTGYLLVCWFVDVHLPNDREVISLRFAVFLNETYNVVALLTPALIVTEVHLTIRGEPAPASRSLPLVNGLYTLLCWIIAASYGAHYYSLGVRSVYRCSGGRPHPSLRCLHSFSLPDPHLVIIELLVTVSYAFARAECTGPADARHCPSSGPLLAEGAPDAPLRGGFPRISASSHLLLSGLVGTLMLYPGPPYLGLTSPLISSFELLCCRILTRLSKHSPRDVEPIQPASHGLTHALQNICRSKGLKPPQDTGRPGEETCVSVLCHDK